MKKITFLFIFALRISGISAQVTFDALTLSNPFPKASQPLSFKFDQKMSPLSNKKNVEIAVYQFTTEGFVVKEPKLKKRGNLYTGTVMIDSNTNTLGFHISSGEIKDNNSGKGYIIPVYAKNNVPVGNYYAFVRQLYAGYGESLFGIAKDPAKNLELVEEGMRNYPDKGFLYENYFMSLSAVKKADAQPIIIEKLREIESKPVLTEGDYWLLSDWYSKYKMNVKADSLSRIMKQLYPGGSWTSKEMFTRFFREKNAAKKAAIYDSLLIKLPRNKSNENTLRSMQSQITNAYNSEGNTAMFAKWARDLPMPERASLYNTISWNMAEENKNLQEAKRLSEEATMWARSQRHRSTIKQPMSFSIKQWKEYREENYAMYADTYAFIMYKLGDYKTGLSYAKAGASFHKLNNPEYNERYAMLLEKAAPPAEAKSIIEKMVKNGKASPKTKEALKALYVREKKTDAGYDQYLIALEEAAKAQKRTEIAKSMINTASPKFALKDWEGKEVSTESMKGKIVVIDFWATWCGPCIASMPGMKNAQDKLAKRDDVKFLFIDTWENAENKLENSKEFMKKKNYPFYVLMDNENKMVEDFGVSGIPTKFILDKAGNIRFKSVGFEGNTDALADEVMTMVEMAGK